ncbi:Mitochondrial genome maintenance MGM101 domain containing protein [Amanita muscaria]
MSSIVRPRFLLAARLANARIGSLPPSTRVSVRALSNDTSSKATPAPPTNNSLNSNKLDSNTLPSNNNNKNSNGNYAQEAQGSQNGVLPEFAVGNGEGQYDWSRSYYGLSSQAFSGEISEILLAPIDSLDIEMKPDGLIYLPEIKYRRILNKAFGPGGWGLAPRGETNVGPKIVSREYALVCQGRLVAIARGEQEYFDPSGIPTATEGCKSNALMRCSKDLGIASELWDPRFIREFKKQHCIEVFAEHIPTKKKRKLWRRKDQPKFSYPYQE